MGGLSPWHWIVVAIVAAILFFGWKQLPDMARSLGRSLRVFKTELKGMGEDDAARDAAKEAAKKAESPAPSTPPASSANGTAAGSASTPAPREAADGTSSPA